MKKIIILTTNSVIPSSSEETVGMLFESPSDSEINKLHPNAIPIDKLIGDQENIRYKSCEVTKKILANEPYIRGIPQFSIFQEMINSELQKAFHIIHLHDFIINADFEICKFHTVTWWGDELSKFVTLIGSPLKVELPKTRKSNKLTRSLYRIYSSHFSMDTIYNEFSQILNQIDPFKRRIIFLKKLSKRKFTKNKPWFYTTALTYTNIGLIYESSFPERFYFLAENSFTGGNPLKKTKRKFSIIYEFAFMRFIPKKKEINHSVNIILKHILNAGLHLNEQESIACKILMASVWVKCFFSRLLPYGLLSSSILEHWIRVTNPSIIIVGNHVFEGYALFKARSENIPTVLLQHGVLSDYFKYSDHFVDHYIVRGKFFYDRLSSISKKRAFIFNPTKIGMKKNIISNKSTIVFVTTPYRLKYLPIDIDLNSILLTLIQTSMEESIELVIRVHPLETANDYKRKIQLLLEKIPCQSNVLYSQGGDLHKLLEKAFAVITFESTVFLDCIEHNIPIIGINWHDFSLKELIEKFGIFYFAKNLLNLKQLLIQAIHGGLTANLDNENLILHNTGIDEITSIMKSIYQTKNQKDNANG